MSSIKKSQKIKPKALYSRKRLTIEEMQQIAVARGGLCLSDTYVNNSSPLLWQCARQHQWQATAMSVKNGGGWCIRCFHDSTRDTLDKMQALAQKRGGNVLSDTYVNCATTLRWSCAQGHTWEAMPSQVSTGSWCPQCKDNASKNKALRIIEELRQIASERGGLCLSDSYVNTDTPLQWQCAQQHRWYAIPNSIKRGSWCQICYRDNQRRSLEEMQALARQRGGALLSGRYTHYQEKLTWRCAQGHTWQATEPAVRAGDWCLRCYHDSMRGSIEEMQALANTKGGRCLSQTYVDAFTHLQWECSVGHIWQAVPATVKKSWCPTCGFERKRLGIEKMQEVARERGGECLSEAYKTVVTRLTWRCAKGHTWQAKPIHIQRGHWCRLCTAESRRIGIEKMQDIAQKHGGICLSDTYVNLLTALNWKCIEGHTWEAKPANVRNGSWCPECRRLGLDQKKKLDARKKKKRFSLPNLL